MSWQSRALNVYLKLTERRHIAHARDPGHLRRSFERKARLFFHAPRGTRFEPLTIDGIDVLRIAPQRARPDRIILYFHGGGYVFGSPNTHRAMVARLAQAAQAEALMPRYPLAPEHKFPAAPNAARRVWDAVASHHASERIAIGGDSAGGGLALALLGWLCADGASKPAAAFALSPLTDLTFSGKSFAENEAVDAVLPASRAREMAQMVLDGAGPDNPRASPLFAEFPGGPPVWICAGDTEILLDDARRMAMRLDQMGVPVTLEIAHDLPHVWPIFHNVLPEAARTLEALADWLNHRWPSSGEN